MKDFYALRGGRVINPAGHWTKDGADRAALATLRRHPKSVVRIVQIIDSHTLESAEMLAAYRRKSAGHKTQEKHSGGSDA